MGVQWVAIYMYQNEKMAVYSLSMIMAFRMLGLFMILPVFSVAAQQIPGATATLIGVTLGAYGLTQALLQMPFGILSDHIGRKPIIATGLLLFAIGSVVAALSHSIHGLILGRTIQGAGAVGSTLLATVADLTRDENRGKAMAFMGLGIGLAFSAALIFGPLVNAWVGLSGIFWLTSGLALIGLILLFAVVPSLQPARHQGIKPIPQKWTSVIKNTELLRLNAGIFSLHATLTALFIIVPPMLSHLLHLSESIQGMFYLIVLGLAFMMALPLIIIAEKKCQMKPFFVSAIAILLITLCLLSYFHGTISLYFLLLVFFAAFIFLEALLPSLASKISPVHNKGTAMGIYSTCQFLGIFVGGSLGGWLFSQFGANGLFAFCAVLTGLWLCIALPMSSPPYLTTLFFKLKQTDNHYTPTFIQSLQTLSGVNEAILRQDEQLLTVKVDQKIINQHELRKQVEAGKLPL